MNSLRRVGIYFLLGMFGSSLHSIPAFARIAVAACGTPAQHVATECDGEHDFDFEIGTWRTHLSRLQHPLTGSTAWVDYRALDKLAKDRLPCLFAKQQREDFTRQIFPLASRMILNKADKILHELIFLDNPKPGTQVASRKHAIAR